MEPTSPLSPNVVSVRERNGRVAKQPYSVRLTRSVCRASGFVVCRHVQQLGGANPLPQPDGGEG